MKEEEEEAVGSAEEGGKEELPVELAMKIRRGKGGGGGRKEEADKMLSQIKLSGVGERAAA